jgi:hypothetical protein
MLSLEQRIYLIQCWTIFRHIITKFNEKFPNIYVSRTDVQKLIKTGSVTNLQKIYSEYLPNSAEQLKQRIRNTVALLTIE